MRALDYVSHYRILENNFIISELSRLRDVKLQVIIPRYYENLILHASIIISWGKNTFIEYFI